MTATTTDRPAERATDRDAVAKYIYDTLSLIDEMPPFESVKPYTSVGTIRTPDPTEYIVQLKRRPYSLEDCAGIADALPFTVVVPPRLDYWWFVVSVTDEETATIAPTTDRPAERPIVMTLVQTLNNDSAILMADNELSDWLSRNFTILNITVTTQIFDEIDVVRRIVTLIEAR